jgi:predicted phosphodiesterase
MRIAIVSDIHGNRTAFDAVLADLRDASPDMILHGGDLADAGASPIDIVDRIRDLGWPGVIGNGEEALAIPDTLEQFARQSTAPPSLWTAVREMASATRALLGVERVAWLGSLPRIQLHDAFALVHAGPNDPWRAPFHNAPDEQLRSVYAALSRPVAVYGHIHVPFVRDLAGFTVANTGSVSLSYDGDPRASYLLIEDGRPSIRRVEYDIEKELKAIAACPIPHADWIARSLRTASPQMP